MLPNTGFLNRRWLLLIVPAIVLLAVAAFAWRAMAQPQLHGIELQGGQPLPDFTLHAAGGQDVRLSDFRGQYVVVFFGYTYCPDVCPMTLAKLTNAMRLLGDDAQQVQVLMVTVDPERDTPERMAEYVRLFDPSFIGLSGTTEEIAVPVQSFGVYYERQPGTTESGYLVAHTASTFVVDRDGRLRVVYPFEVEGPDIAADLKTLIRQ